MTTRNTRLQKLTAGLLFLLRHLWVALLIAICLGLGWLLRAGFAPAGGAGAEATAEDHSGHKGAEAEVPDEVWTCSMHPQIRMSEPGDCPICGMDLVPMSAGDPGSLRRLVVRPAAHALMQVETFAVERRAVEAEVRMVGKLEYDETRLADLTAWVPGRIERMYVDYTGIEVKRGDHMVQLFSPKLYADQSALLQAMDAAAVFAQDRGDAEAVRARANLDAARERLRQLGLTPEQIAEIETRGTPSEHITIYAPTGGVVVHREGLVGRYVKEGSNIYTIADLSHLWVQLDAYESDLPWLHYGQDVEFTTEAWPGEVFHGTIAFISPEIGSRTRTAKVRVNLPNPDGRLKPEMFVKAVVRTKLASGGRAMDAGLAGKWICPMHPEVLRDEPGACDVCGMDLVTTESRGYVAVSEDTSELPLVIPTSAALLTGKRAVVYVEVEDADDPTYEGREIVLGPRAGDWYLVRHGLVEGQRVVTKGNFKIDSALQIQAKPSMMSPTGGTSPPGHDHGGGEIEMDQAPAGAVEVPSSAKLGLAQVEEALLAVRLARTTDDLPALHAAFVALAEAVASVDVDAFLGAGRAQWTEVAMHLGNDAAEGQDLSRIAGEEALFDLLGEHVERMRRTFGTSPAEPGAPRLEVPAAFAASLAELWDGYLELHAALAGDDQAGAASAAKRSLAAITEPPVQELTEDARTAWDDSAAKLRDALALIANGANGAETKDIELAREEFERVSQAATALQARFGLGDGPVYLVECPMAFGRGARWLQAKDDVLNPYYGSSMLECGSVLSVLADGGRDGE